MSRVKFFCGLSVFLTSSLLVLAQEAGPWGGLKAGPFAPGFRLIETSDGSRSFPGDDAGGLEPRPMRIYLWYPGRLANSGQIRINDYIEMALGDFRPPTLPVPLAKGLKPEALKALRESPGRAFHGAEPASGRFPVLVFGQGLFYESPLAHFILCELLASHGYVVATCPLLGTRYRLVNINIEDIETEVRDMEFVLAEARRLPFADPGKLGVVGYDLGGMAGLIMAMRNPDVDAFLSLDSGILDKHYSGLPATHPQYREERFRIPWMHMLQARFVRPEKDRSSAPSLFERKAAGSSYLVHVPTTSHGQFSSYSALGITAAVPAYWGPPAADSRRIYEAICRISLAFFDDSLKGEAKALEGWLQAPPETGSAGPGFKIETKAGAAASPGESELVNMIIDRGIEAAGPSIERARAERPGAEVVDEQVLNWLGLHFLYWWGREDDAVGVFELNVSLHPKSWQASDGLGDAYEALGRKDEAIRTYRRSLELNPDDRDAKAALERLSPTKKNGNGETRR